MSESSNQRHLLFIIVVQRLRMATSIVASAKVFRFYRENRKSFTVISYFWFSNRNVMCFCATNNYNTTSDICGLCIFFVSACIIYRCDAKLLYTYGRFVINLASTGKVITLLILLNHEQILKKKYYKFITPKNKQYNFIILH